jgi:type II secretory pathway component PulF
MPTAHLNSKEKLTLISMLGTMLNSGIPIMESVETLLAESKGNQKKVLEKIKKDLNQGKSLSDSLMIFPDSFDQVTVNLVKASEESGTLATTLKNLTGAIRKDIEFNEKVKGALTYPIFVILVFVGVLLMILAFVVPRIATVFSRLRVTLPLPTRILIIISNFFVQYYMIIFGMTVLGGIGLIYFYKRHRKAFLDTFFSLPGLKQLAMTIDLTSFTRSLSLLLSSGIPITEALNLSSNVVAKKEVARALLHTQEMVQSGKKLSEGLRAYPKIIPQILVRLTEAGEKAGTLEKSMQEASEYLDVEVNSKLKAFTTLLEPIMLVVIGLLVGGMMLAIIAPIYGLIGQIQTR